MILLCSDGLTGDALLTGLRERITKEGKAALVVTADEKHKEKNYHVPRCREDLEKLGFSVDLFDIDTEDAGRLLGYGLVEFIGGNPFYLLRSVRRAGAGPVLEKLAAERMLIGWSAAAIVFGPSLELVNGYTPEMNTVGLTDLNGLCLTETEVLPHYGRYLRRFDRFEEKCALYEQRKGKTVIRLNDGDGVFIDGSRTVIVRAQPME